METLFSTLNPAVIPHPCLPYRKRWVQLTALSPLELCTWPQAHHTVMVFLLDHCDPSRSLLVLHHLPDFFTWGHSRPESSALTFSVMLTLLVMPSRLLALNTMSVDSSKLYICWPTLKIIINKLLLHRWWKMLSH